MIIREAKTRDTNNLKSGFYYLKSTQECSYTHKGTITIAQYTKKDDDDESPYEDTPWEFIAEERPLSSEWVNENYEVLGPVPDFV